jgi:hypothetical protein
MDGFGLAMFYFGISVAILCAMWAVPLGLAHGALWINRRLRARRAETVLEFSPDVWEETTEEFEILSPTQRAALKCSDPWERAERFFHAS